MKRFEAQRRGGTQRWGGFWMLGLACRRDARATVGEGLMASA